MSFAKKMARKRAKELKKTASPPLAAAGGSRRKCGI